MAKRSVTGQLNMFELFNSLESPGEVQMVSLMPEDEPEVIREPKVEEVKPVRKEKKPEKPQKQKIESQGETARDLEITSQKMDAQVAMRRIYEMGGEQIEIAYINYNKVRITKGNQAPETKMFASSKEAVDYYVEKMQELEADE